jgi:hypothetical protein
MEITNFDDYQNLINSAQSNAELTAVVELADELYLKDTLKMNDNDWPKITSLLNQRWNDLNGLSHA